MNQELHRLLERLSQEIFHEENYNAIPSMERIKAAMAALNEYAGKRHLTEAPPRPDDAGENCFFRGGHGCQNVRLDVPWKRSGG